MLLSEKLTLILILMTIVILVISVNIELVVFFVMILIAVLIIRELIETFASNEIKDRINFFIYTGFIIFIGIIVQKILIDLA